MIKIPKTKAEFDQLKFLDKCKVKGHLLDKTFVLFCNSLSLDILPKFKGAIPKESYEDLVVKREQVGRYRVIEQFLLILTVSLKKDPSWFEVLDEVAMDTASELYYALNPWEQTSQPDPRSDQINGNRVHGQTLDGATSSLWLQSDDLQEDSPSSGLDLQPPGTPAITDRSDRRNVSTPSEHATARTQFPSTQGPGHPQQEQESYAREARTKTVIYNNYYESVGTAVTQVGEKNETTVQQQQQPPLPTPLQDARDPPAGMERSQDDNRESNQTQELPLPTAECGSDVGDTFRNAEFAAVSSQKDRTRRQNPLVGHPPRSTDGVVPGSHEGHPLNPVTENCPVPLPPGRSEAHETQVKQHLQQRKQAVQSPPQSGNLESIQSTTSLSPFDEAGHSTELKRLLLEQTENVPNVGTGPLSMTTSFSSESGFHETEIKQVLSQPATLQTSPGQEQHRSSSSMQSCTNSLHHGRYETENGELSISDVLNVRSVGQSDFGASSDLVEDGEVKLNGLHADSPTTINVGTTKEDSRVLPLVTEGTDSPHDDAEEEEEEEEGGGGGEGEEKEEETENQQQQEGQQQPQQQKQQVVVDPLIRTIVAETVRSAFWHLFNFHQ